MIYEPRQYQIEATQEVSECFRDDAQAVVLCIPTGGGKTVVFADMALSAIRNGFAVMILCNRKELIDQADKKLRRLGLHATLINPSYKKHKESMCYVASIDTLRNRQLPYIGLLIVDEGHIRSFDKIVLEYKSRGTLIVCATATPARKGRKFLDEGSRLSIIYPKYTGQMGDVYDKMVIPTTIPKLLEQAYLVPPIYYVPENEIDLSDVKKKGGDFDEADLFKKFNKPKLYDGVIDNYIKHANGTKALSFNVNVEHSKNMTIAFNERGIPSEHVDGKTPEGERVAIFERFRIGVTMVLNNYGVATTGYDEPSIETIILNSATESLPLYLQKLGRGSRLCPEINKAHFIVLDHGSHVRRLGWWEEDREWSLDLNFVSKKAGVGPVRHCENCEALLPLTTTVCPHCSIAQEKQAAELKLHTSEFVLLEKNTIPPELKKPIDKMSIVELEKYRELKQFSLPWISRILLMRGIESLKEYGKLKGYAPGWAYRQQEVATNTKKNAFKPIWTLIKNNPHITPDFLTEYAHKKLKSTHSVEQINNIMPSILDVWKHPWQYEDEFAQL